MFITVSLMIEVWTFMFPCSRMYKLVCECIWWGGLVGFFSVLPSFFLNCGKSLTNKQILWHVCKPMHTWVKLNFPTGSDD